MKSYSYKIQWLFPVTTNFIATQKELKKDLFNIIKILGVKSLDKIIFRDKDLKIIDYYRGYIQYPNGSAEKETIKYINKLLKQNQNVYYVELLRK